MFHFLIALLLLSCFTVDSASPEKCDGTVRYLQEDDWQDILEGKWVVKFFAHWCPACKSFKTDWEDLAKELYAKGYCVASADVSINAGLSGRFFVTSLPTIYFIRDGEIRMYSGPRSKEEIVKFVIGEGWKDTPTVPWYISPTSYHMATLGAFFRFSMALRNLHTTITEDYGIPVWISYIFFAFLTILIGLIVGLLIVFLCDIGLGPASSAERKKRSDLFGMETTIEDEEEDVIDEDEFEVKDDEDDDDNDDETADAADEAGDNGKLDEDEGDQMTDGGGEPRKRKNIGGDQKCDGDKRQ